MPFLPDEHSTDKLLKNLGIELAAQIGSRDLASFGWFQYRDHDHIKSLVATEFAAHAFLYLSFDATGSWRRNPRVITAVLAFLSRYYNVPPRPDDLRKLKQLIDVKPFDAQAIVNWFHGIYPPEPAPPSAS